jgi:hypothetical protein
MGETAEWRLPEPSSGEGLDLSAISDGNLGEGAIEIHRASEDEEPGSDEDETRETSETNQMDDLYVRPAGDDRPAETESTRIVVDDVELPDLMATEGDPRASSPPEFGDRADWFSAGDGEPEWPAFARPRRKDHEGREPSKDRVRYLFPVPDATDWSVGELRYDRKRGS